MPIRDLVPAVLVCTFLSAGVVSAQPLGIFRWQQQPFCNVITVNVTQNGGVFQLDGSDDQCGAATSAAVVGIAFLNPNGSVGLGMTLVTTPGGTPLHIDASISVATGSGTWRDSSGATGVFALTPGAGTAGSARPVPRAAFPAGLSAGGTTITNVATPVAGSDAATKAYVDAADATKANTVAVTAAIAAAVADVRLAMIGEKIWKAQVNSNGTKQGTGPFTSTRFGTGSYNVIFDVTGLGLPGSIFAVGAAIPVFCTGGSATIGSRSTTSTNNILTNFGMSVLVTTGAAVATDCEIELLATFPDANLGSPIPPLVPGDGHPGVTCTTAGIVTTCVTGPEPQ